MTDKQALLDLAKRCEDGVFNQGELLLDAWREIYPQASAGDREYERFRLKLWGRFAALLKAEAYLDAAMTLLPEGWRGQIQFGKFPGAWIGPPGNEDANDFNVAATPALALITAYLRARAEEIV